MDLGGANLLARLSAWAATAAADEAAAARARERWLRRAAEEEGSFAGVLLDLGERGAPVVVTGAAGRRHCGVVAAVGDGVVVLRTAEGAVVLLAASSVGSVRAEPRAAPVTGDRAVALDDGVGMVEALSVLAEDRPRVLVVTMSGEGLAGELVGVGRDVVTLRLDGADRTTAYVAVASVAEVRPA